MPSTARWPGTCPERSRRSGWPILVASFATRVGPSICAMPSRNNFVIPDRSEAITLSSRPERSEVEGPCVFAPPRKRSSRSSRRKPASFTSGQSRRQCYRETGRICHPERSNCFAQRSGCGVEGPLPAQIGRRPSGNSPMLAPTNSLRQSTSRLVFVPGMTGDLRQPRFLLGSEMDFHACQSRRPGAPLLPIHREGWALGPQL